MSSSFKDKWYGTINIMGWPFFADVPKCPPEWPHPGYDKMPVLRFTDLGVSPGRDRPRRTAKTLIWQDLSCCLVYFVILLSNEMVGESKRAANTGER